MMLTIKVVLLLSSRRSKPSGSEQQHQRPPNWFEASQPSTTAAAAATTTAAAPATRELFQLPADHDDAAGRGATPGRLPPAVVSSRYSGSLHGGHGPREEQPQQVRLTSPAR
jgi:hypothetical protein